MQKHYPIRLADKTWDNTGLLVDASTDEPLVSEAVRMLLTIDLTQDVADEAIRHRSHLIMAYHPFIFRGLKSITPRDPQQKSMLKLIRSGVSVYCPHTAVDSARGGVNDFLADTLVAHSGAQEALREVIEQDKEDKDCGMGRIVTLLQPTALSKLVEGVKQSLNISHVQVALARQQGASDSHGGRGDRMVSRIAICAGSGGSVFRGVEADLFYTGELSHHEALYFAETGSSVIVCNHSNTERAFLQVMREQMLAELPAGSEVVVSEADKDPFATW